jgi:hypothetical protein
MSIVLYTTADQANIQMFVVYSSAVCVCLTLLMLVACYPVAAAVVMLHIA